MNISSSYKNKETFFLIKINDKNTKIFYFENNSLKFEQNFKFGKDIVINDISKITSLKFDEVRHIMSENEISKI